ncbi:MotA/TolQ/ExbB proton channel family protein [Anoxybacillus sp. D401a]|uniref:MotA/TolQ/ExbB proton channel family protein n=1 Tax=Anoxybacillus sp. D401a TaxID=575112 RepID=UPI003D358E29
MINIITIFTLGILSIIAIIAVYLNESVYTFLQQVDEDLDGSEQNNSFIGTVKQLYDKEKSATENDLNIQNFLEAYISSFYLSDKFGNKLKLVQRLKLVQTASSICILVGVLGTFIGLVFALKGIDTDSTKMGESLINVLDGAHTAFYTSIAGIIFSIFVNVYTKFHNGEQLLVQVMLKIENYLSAQNQKTIDLRVIEALQEVKGAIVDMNRSFFHVYQFSQVLEVSTSNLNRFNEGLNQNIDKLSHLFGDMENFTNNYNRHMSALNNQLESIHTVLEKQNKLTTDSVEFMANMQKEHRDFSENHQKQMLHMHESFVEVVRTIHKLKEEINSYFAKHDENFQNLYDVQMELKNDLNSYFQKYTEKLQHIYEKQSNFYTFVMNEQNRLLDLYRVFQAQSEQYIQNIQYSTNTLKDAFESGVFENISLLSKTLKADIGHIQQLFDELVDQLHSINSTQIEYYSFYSQLAKDMEERFSKQHEYNGQFLSYVQSFSDYATHLSEYTNRLHQLFTETKNVYVEFDSNSRQVSEQLIAFVEGITKELKVYIESGSKQSHEVKNAIEDFIGSSVMKLESMIKKLDSSLGEAIKDSLRNFERYVEVTNRIISQQMNSLISESEINREAQIFSTQALYQSIEKLNKQMENFSTILTESYLVRSKDE